MSKKKTLSPDEIVSTRGMSRRSMLGVVGGGLAVGAATAIVGEQQQAGAQQAMELVSDSDTGGGADPANRPSTGATDRDNRGGPDGSGDPGGYGVCARRGHSDSDSGGSSDPGGGGRGPCR